MVVSESRPEACLAHDISLVRGPPNSVEDRYRVEVVTPVSDLAIRDREHRDVPVGVGSSGRNDSAFGGVLEHDDAGGGVVVDGKVIAAVEEEGRAVRTIQLGDSLASFDVAAGVRGPGGSARSRDL